MDAPTEGPGRRFCSDTGLAVPECSCQRCLEAMLRDFRPELLGGEIQVRRTSDERRRRPNVQPDQPGYGEAA